MAELEHVTEALVVRPGDHLIIRVPRETSDQEALEMCESAREHLPDVVAVTVVRAEQLAVVRKEDADAAGQQA